MWVLLSKNSSILRQRTPKTFSLRILSATQLTPNLPHHRDLSSYKTPFYQPLNSRYLLRASGPPYSQGSFYYSIRPFTGSNEVVVPVPSMGDSISEGTLNHWKKNVGDFIKADEVIAVIDTDKVSVDINSPQSGQITNLNVKPDDVVLVGAPLFSINTAAPIPVDSANTESKTTPNDVESTKQSSKPNQSNGSKSPSQEPAPPTQPAPQHKTDTSKPSSLPQAAKTLNNRAETRVPMSRMRQRIAERLKDAQSTAVMLTTFNECDMGPLIAMRSEMKDDFQEAHGVKMGFVSAFILASTLSLKKFPIVNAHIEGKEIVYKDYIDIGVAVATPNGLMVPIISDCHTKSWAELEKNLDDLAKRARKNQIALEELSGGNFTISNGGVYGNMMGTPLINPPQSSILGMHAIKKRPVVINDQIVIRPMMYLALTYDHRLLDGREAVLYLGSIKDYIENPNKMLLNL